MKIMKITDPTLVAQSVNVLKDNGILILPTIRWYMFCCGAANRAGLDEIFRAKKRSFNKPPLFLVPSEQSARELFTIGKHAGKLIRNFWPGEIAMYLNWNSKEKAEKFCLENKEFALVSMFSGIFGKIVTAYEEPVLSTTVNVSNIDASIDKGPAISVEEVKNFICETNVRVNFVADGGVCPAFNHTTIIDCRKEDQALPQIVREGYVHKRAINFVFGIDNERINHGGTHDGN